MTEKGIITTYESGGDVIFEWKIEDFFNLPERDGTCYDSPEFSFGGETWWLTIWPNGWSGSDSSGHVDLSLKKWHSDRSIKQSFSLSLKTAKEKKYNEQHNTKDFDNDYWFHEFNRFIPRSQLGNRRSDLVPEGILTVICTMKSSTSAGSDNYNCREKLLMFLCIASILIAVVTGCILAYSKTPLSSTHPCGDLVMSNKQLQEKIAQLEAVAETLKARESELNAIKKEHGELKCTYESIASEKNKLQYCLDSEKQNLVQLKKEMEEKQSKIDSITKELRKKETDFNDFKNKNEKLILMIKEIESEKKLLEEKATENEKPLSQPVLMVTEIGSTYLEIVWVLPEESKTDAAHILHYIVHFRKYGAQWQEVAFPDASRTSYSLTNLVPGMSYQIYVMAVDSSGFSRSSETATIRTSNNVISHNSPKGQEKQFVFYATAIIILVIVIACVYDYSKTSLSATHPYGGGTQTISAEDNIIKADLSEVAEANESKNSDSKTCSTETEGPVLFKNQPEDYGFVIDINHLLKENRGIDVTFELETPSGETKLFSHKLILAVMSSYFADEFYDKGRNKGHQVIPLKGINPKAFEQMIRYCYGEKPIFKTTEEACILFKIASEFKVISLQNLCCNFFRHTKINPGNVFSILEISEEMEDKSLKDKCRKILQDKTREFMASYELRDVTPAMVHILLDLPSLSLDSEYELIKWIFDWAKVKSEDKDSSCRSTRDYLAKLLQNINFLALTVEEFAILSRENPKVFNSDERASISLNIACPGSWEMPVWYNKDLKLRVYTGSIE